MSDHINKSLQKVSAWFSNQIIDKDLFGIWKGGTPSLLPTCFTVLSCENLGLRFADTTSETIIRYLQQNQSPDDGLFTPGSIHHTDLSSHTSTYLRLQATYFAIHALDALNSRPHFPIKIAGHLKDPAYLRGWIDAGPWENPWLHSNNIMFALTFLQADHERSRNEEMLVAFDSVLDYLDERQDPDSGLWQPVDRRDDRNALYGAYHFFPYYVWRGREIQHVDRIIDTTLQIQDNCGTYGGGACEDLDAVHTLVIMSTLSNYRVNDVRRSLERCLWRLLQIQNQDGGFPNYPGHRSGGIGWKRKWAEKTGLLRILPSSLKGRGTAEVQCWKYSGWAALSCPYGESDAWGGWFRPLAIKLICERYPEICGRIKFGAYRKLPGLGWHNPNGVGTGSEIGSALIHSSVA